MGIENMKELGFAPDLIQLILNGSKTVTWRLFDDRNLSVDDEVVCVHQFTREPFAKIVITSVTTKRLKNINDVDRAGHEKVEGLEDILGRYQKYYSRSLTGEDEVKIIRFQIKIT